MLSILEAKGLPMGTVQDLDRGHWPTLDPVIAKMAFFYRKIDSVLSTVPTLLEIAVTLDQHTVHFYLV